MSDRSRVALSLAAAVLVLAACAGLAAKQTPAPTTARTPAPSPARTPAPGAPASLITAGKVVDCVDIEYPPMEYFPSAEVTDPAQAIGFDIDSARAVAAQWGLEIDIRNTSFGALVPDLLNDRCDIVWTALFVDNTRLAVADAVPYLATGQVVMVRAGNPANITSLADLCGKDVAIQSGGVVEEKIIAASANCTSAGNAAIHIHGYPTVPEEFQQIVSDRVQAVWETDTAVANWMVMLQGEYEIAFVVSRDDAYGVYFQKDHQDIGSALMDALAAIKADGSWADIANEYAQDPQALAPACPRDTANKGCHALP